MPGELVTVATFGAAEDAKLARDRLIAAGVRARLIDDPAGLSLRVPTDDADHARQVLGDGEIGGENPAEEVDPPPAADAHASASLRDELAGRALAVALASIFLIPLLPYACWLVGSVFFSDQRLSTSAHRRALAAACICVPLTLAWAFFLTRFIK